MPDRSMKRNTCERENDFTRDAQSLSSLLVSAVEHMCSMSASGAAIALRRRDGLCCAASTGEAPPVGSRLEPDSFARECLKTGRVVVCQDAEKDSRIKPSTAQTLNLRSAVAVPIQTHGSTVGIIEVFSSSPSDIFATDVAALERIAGVAARVVPPKKHWNKVHWLTMGVASALVLAVITYGYHLNRPRVATHGGAIPRIAAARREPVFPQERVSPEQDYNANGQSKAPDSVLTATREEVIQAIPEPVQGTDVNRVLNRANAGDPIAQYEMAVRYADGEGVPQNYQDAMAWFAKAAANGNEKAQWKLGLGYIKGIGVPHDEREAVMWFKRAANRGDIRAQSALSDVYLSGRGVPRDYVRAYTWANIAAGLGENDNDRLKAIRSRMTAIQIEDADRRTSIWWEHERRRTANSGQASEIEVTNSVQSSERGAAKSVQSSESDAANSVRPSESGATKSVQSSESDAAKSVRPSESEAITATYVGIKVKEIDKAHATLFFSYDLENNTDIDYRLADIPDVFIVARGTDGSLRQEEALPLSYPTFLPAKQRVRIAIEDERSFAWPRESDPGSDDKLKNFVRERLQNIAGFVLFDEVDHIQIELPSGWATVANK
jgi:putative methionine-R-sulfoxide reductase with GAF domain